MPGGSRLASLTDSASASAAASEYSPTQSWVYDSQGNVRRAGPTEYTYDARGNPVSEVRLGFARTATYDDANRLSSVTEADGLHQYILHPDGRRASEVLPNGHSLAYGYNSTLGALTSVVDSAAPDSPEASVSLSVDSSGRVYRATSPDGVDSFTWSPDGRLVAANGVSFSYDALGLRRTASDSRQWVYVGEELLGESFFPGPTTGLQTSWQLGALTLAQGDVRFVVDALGSPVSDSQGNSTSYSAWGAPSRVPAVGSPSVSFTGYRAESARLQFGQQRWLLAGLGVFASVDPVGPQAYLQSPNGLGPWTYAAGNPMRYVDPDGRSEKDVLCIANGGSDCDIFGAGGAETVQLAIRVRDSGRRVMSSVDGNRGERVAAYTRAMKALSEHMSWRYDFNANVGLPVVATAGGLGVGLGATAGLSGPALSYYLGLAWKSGAVGKTAVLAGGTAAVASVPAMVRGVQENYSRCSNYSGAGDLGACFGFGMDTGGLVEPAAEGLVAAPGFLNKAVATAADYYAALRASPNWVRRQAGSVRFGEGPTPSQLAEAGARPQVGAPDAARVAQLQRRLKSFVDENVAPEFDEPFEVFVHGTTTTKTATFGLDPSKHLFATARAQTAEIFGLRTVGREGGKVGGFVYALPRSRVAWLRQQGLMRTQQVPDMPGHYETIFEPGAFEYLEKFGVAEPLPAEFFAP